jgi:hypothetical protein
MTKWKVEVNSEIYYITATNAWTATTRAIKKYWQFKQSKDELNSMAINVEKL